MEQVFADRLKSARIMASLSQDELVRRIEGLVSKNAISKYEKGEMMPNTHVLVALAKALNVKSDYFYRDFSVSITNIEFRKKSGLGVKKMNAIKEIVIDRVSRYLELEQFLNIQSAFDNPIQKIQIRNKVDVEDAAVQLLQAWNLGLNAIPNVIEMLEDREIKVVEIDASENFDGFAGWADEKYPVIVLNKNFSLERKRLTALHELGHLLLNFDEGLSPKEIERMCFQFGGALLIPGVTFFQEFGKKRAHLSVGELVSMKESFGMSIQAIMARAKGLEIISDFTYVKFNKWISRNKKESGLGKYIGVEQSKRFNRLLYRATSEEIISLSKAANLSNQKLAEFRREFVAI